MLNVSGLCGAGNSDPEKLKEEAADVQKLSADELLKRRQEIKVINAASLRQYSDACEFIISFVV